MRATDAVATVLVGALIGAAVTFALDEHPAPALILAGAALGAVLASALRQAIGSRP
jgi:uncharacterized membrane protein